LDARCIAVSEAVAIVAGWNAHQLGHA